MLGLGGVIIHGVTVLTCKNTHEAREGQQVAL